MSNELQLLCRAEILRLQEAEIMNMQENERSLSDSALKSLREFRKSRVANRKLPCQPKAA